jgi:hypothetical protein
LRERFESGFRESSNSPKGSRRRTVIVYTRIRTGFLVLGPPDWEHIATDVTKFERIKLVDNYYGIVFQNSHTKSWHVAVEDCGALAKTHAKRAAAILQAMDDSRTGDKKIMKQQIEQGKKDRDKAEVLSNDVFFGKFRK